MRSGQAVGGFSRIVVMPSSWGVMAQMILQRPIGLADMEAVDAEYHRSLCWVLENDPEPLELTFQACSRQRRGEEG